jgi:hypothetical protein
MDLQGRENFIHPFRPLLGLFAVILSWWKDGIETIELIFMSGIDEHDTRDIGGIQPRINADVDSAERRTDHDVRPFSPEASSRSLSSLPICKAVLGFGPGSLQA